MADPTGAVWRKSTRSGNGGNCVEVATNLLPRQGVVFVRDSKDRRGGHLTVDPASWMTFASWIKGRE
ncbi:DUF397 domain-containing protein [Micromonospora chokoriensis]